MPVPTRMPAAKIIAMKVYRVTLPPPIAVGQLAAERPRDRAEQRTDERDLRRVQRGLRGGVAAGEEVDLQHLAEGEARTR